MTHNPWPTDYPVADDDLTWIDGRPSNESIDEIWEDELRNSIVHVARNSGLGHVLDIVDEEVALIRCGGRRNHVAA